MRLPRGGASGPVNHVKSSMLGVGNNEGRRVRRTRRMGKLIMVRHGESEGNRDRRFNITPDIPITELGRKQAQEAAERIARMFRPEAIIASPYLRARQTAEIIAEPLGLPVEVVDDLHERDLGALKGESYDALRELVRKDPAHDPKPRWLGMPHRGQTEQ